MDAQSKMVDKKVYGSECRIIQKLILFEFCLIGFSNKEPSGL